MLAKDNPIKKASYNETYRNKETAKLGRRVLESLKIVCVCGAKIRKYGVKQHESTSKHINWITLNKIQK